MPSEFTRLEPHVIAEVVTLCDRMLAELTAAKDAAAKLGTRRDFGELESAKQLAAGFARKGRGTPESAYERTEQFIVALTNIRDAFATGGDAFLGADFDWARRLTDTDADR